jgi:LysR family transcriptional regulator, transcriptional activator for dmlA
VLRDNEATFGTWRFNHKAGAMKVEKVARVKGSLSSNDGETVVRWALEGRGVALRSQWDVATHLESGALVQGLVGYEGERADIYAVYQERQKLSARVRVFVDFLLARFEKAAWTKRR